LTSPLPAGPSVLSHRNRLTKFLSVPGAAGARWEWHVMKK
jgi:hypothetical protein